MIFFSYLLQKYSIKVNYDLYSKIVKKLMLFLLIISLIPIFILSFYNVLQADDWSSIYPLYWNLQEHNILSAVLFSIKDSFILLVNYMKTWGGYYTGVIAYTWIPAAFSDKLVWMNTVILCGALLWALYFFWKNIAYYYFKQSKNMKWSGFAVTSLIIINWMPFGCQAFYWYTGSFYNVIGFAAALYLVSKLFFCMQNKYIVQKYDWIKFIFVAFVLGGTNYSIILVALLLVTIEIVDVLLSKGLPPSNKIMYIAVVIFMFLAAFINIFAPGNAVRQQEMGEHASAIHTIIGALLVTRNCIFEYFNVWIICLLLILLPVIWHNIDIRRNIPKPLICFTLGYLLYSAALTPTLYTMGSLGAGRTQNVYWCFFMVWLIMTYISLLGTIKKYVSSKEWLSKIIDDHIILVIVILIVFTVVFTGRKDESITNMVSYEAARELWTKEAQTYKAEADIRLRMYNDNTIQDVLVSPYSVTPPLLFYNDLGPGVDHEWIGFSIARYYHKNSVTLKE